MSQISLHRYVRFLHGWHGLDRPDQGRASLEAALERLQGYVLPFSDLEDLVLPARVEGYRLGDIDHLCENGSLRWQGHERIGGGDGAISVFRAENAPQLARIRALLPGRGCAELRNFLADSGPAEFDGMVNAVGGFPPQILDQLWRLVWAGEVSNERLTPLLSLMSVRRRHSRYGRGAHGFRYRPKTLPGSAGRWYLISGPDAGTAPQSDRDRALIAQLLRRWGVVAPRTLLAEGIGGGMARFGQALKALEEEGHARRGAFVDSLGGTQYASPAALDALAKNSGCDGAWLVAATDPVNPYGRLVPWPRPAAEKCSPQRVAGARVVLSDRGLIGYLAASGNDLITFPGSGSDRKARERINDVFSALARSSRPDRIVLLRTIDGQHPSRSAWSRELESSGFRFSRGGYFHRP